MNLRPDKLYTIATVEADEAHPIKPEFIRLPRPGQQCPYTGLTRSYLNSLILPSEANGHDPPVKSVCLRPRGAQRGVRLIHYESLLEYLYGMMEERVDQ